MLASGRYAWLRGEGIYDVPKTLQSLFDLANRNAVCSCKPEYPGETSRNDKLPTKFAQYRGIMVLLNKCRCQLTPLFVGYRNKLQKNHFQIVAVTLRLAYPQVVSRVEVNQDCSFRNRVVQDVVEMQIAVRPCRLVIAAWNLVNSPQFAGGGDERCYVELACLEPLSQTGTANPGNDHGWSRTDLRACLTGVKQPLAMDLPIQPFVSSNKHANAAACQSQELVSEPNNQTSTSAALLHNHGNAVLHALLNPIHADLTHQPGNSSLQRGDHERPPKGSRLVLDAKVNTL